MAAYTTLECMDSNLGLSTPPWEAGACFVCSFLGFSWCQTKMTVEKTKGLCSSRRNIRDMLTAIQIVKIVIPGFWWTEPVPKFDCTMQIRV